MAALHQAQEATAAEVVEATATLRGQVAEADIGGSQAAGQVVAQEVQVARVVRVDLEVPAAAALAEDLGEITAEEGAVGMVPLLRAEVLHRQVATQVGEAPVRPVTGQKEPPDNGRTQRCSKSCGRLHTRSRFSSRTT